jgi:hypothetical protein
MDVMRLISVTPVRGTTGNVAATLIITQHSLIARPQRASTPGMPLGIPQHCDVAYFGDHTGTAGSEMGHEL